MPSVFSLSSTYTIFSHTANTDASLDPCKDIDNCRTRWDVIWSCLTTIFLCTWVAIHPNIPEPIDDKGPGFWTRTKHWFRTFLRERMLLFMVALLVPDYILSWAIRQRLVAYNVAKKYENLGLTTVHGFFIVMGGCHRYEIPHPPSEHGYSSVVDITAPTIGNSGSRNSDADADADANDNLPGQSPEVRHSVELVTNQDNREDNREEVSPVYEARNEEDSESQKSRKVGGRPVHPLGRKEVIWLIENKKFDLPIKAEILDKSKSDWIAKGFAILQTSWFILQCITRAVEHLPMAELELVTLAYAIVNMGIYAAWWYKPCKVDRPVRVFAEIPENEDERRKYEQELKFLGNTKRERLIVTAWCYILGDTDKSAYLHDLRRTPTFYSGNPGDTRITIANGVTLTVGLIFGGIHCIAWSFHFPSQVERILWRSASAIIVGIPLLLVIIGGPVSLLWPKGLPLRNRNIFERILMRIAYVIIVAIPILVGVLYVFARAMILVLVFAALRSLPPRAYEAVQWTNFIPHI